MKPLEVVWSVPTQSRSHGGDFGKGQTCFQCLQDRIPIAFLGNLFWHLIMTCTTTSNLFILSSSTASLQISSGRYSKRLSFTYWFQLEINHFCWERKPPKQVRSIQVGWSWAFPLPGPLGNEENVNACWRWTWIVHSKCAVRKTLTVWDLCISCTPVCLRCSSKPSPWVLQWSCKREQDLRLWGQRPGRSTGTHNSSSAQQWLLGPSQPPPLLLGFFPTKGIQEWFYILLWNPYTSISQYVCIKECKWFQNGMAKQHFKLLHCDIC